MMEFTVSNPSYGQRLLWLTLVVSAYLAFDVHLDYSELPKANTVSLIGLLFPLDWGESYLVVSSRTIFLISGALWGLRIGVPWSSWCATFSYTFLISTYWENLPWFRHKFILPNLILFVLALWYQFYRREIGAPKNWPDFFGSPIEPSWVKFLSLWSLIMFYGLSGVSKLLGGWSFLDGTSLQLWFHLMVEPGHPVREAVLGAEGVAAFLQTGAWLVELSSFGALFFRWYRMPLAVLLSCFHLIVQWTFGIPFLTNIPLIWAILIPKSEPDGIRSE